MSAPPDAFDLLHPWPRKLDAQIERAREPFEGLVPDLMLFSMTQAHAWILKGLPVAVDLMGQISSSLIEEVPPWRTPRERHEQNVRTLFVMLQVDEQERKKAAQKGDKAYRLPRLSLQGLTSLVLMGSLTPVPPLPFELADGALLELGDAIHAAQLLGLLEEVERKPRLLKDWGKYGAALEATLPRARGARDKALARLTPAQRKLLAVSLRQEWEPKRVSKILREDERKVQGDVSAALRELGMGFRIGLTGWSESEEEAALREAAVALYLEELPPDRAPFAPMFGLSPRVSREIERAGMPYGRILPAAFILPMTKALGFLLTHHPVGLGALARTAEGFLPDAPPEPAHLLGTMRGLSVVCAWGAALDELRPTIRADVVLPEIAFSALGLFLGWLGEPHRPCWLEQPPPDMPSVLEAFGDAILALQTLAIVHEAEARPAFLHSLGRAAKLLGAFLPRASAVKNRALMRLPADVRAYLDACLAAQWDPPRVAARLRNPEDMMFRLGTDAFRLLGMAFRDEMAGIPPLTGGGERVDA